MCQFQWSVKHMALDPRSEMAKLSYSREISDFRELHLSSLIYPQIFILKKKKGQGD